MPTSKVHSRLLTKLLKRNSFRIAAMILLVQVLYVFGKLNVYLASRHGGYSFRGDPYAYNYIYDNEVVQHPGRPHRSRAMAERVVRSAGRGDVKISYDEDYDHLDDDPSEHQEQQKPPEAEEPNHQEPAPDLVEEPKKEPPLQPLILAPIKPANKPVPPKAPEKSAKEVSICTMEQRVQHMRAYCNTTKVGDDRKPNYKKGRYGGLLVDEKHKLIFCDVSQAASLAWSTILAYATGKVRGERPAVRFKRYMKEIGLTYLDTYENDERDKMLQEYFKFMIVQHPLDRMVQVWRARLYDSLPSDAWRKKLGRQIILTYRKVNNRSILPEELSIYDTARLEEFLEYAFVERDMQDPLWFTYLQVCHPCEIQYDAIMRAETMKNDAELVFDMIEEDYWDGIPGDIPVKVHMDLTEDETFFKPYQNVSIAAQDKLLLKFEHDMGMFGYSWNTKNKSAKCSIVPDNKQPCC